MLNRTIEPGISIPESINIIKPATQTLENGIELNVINAGEEEVLKLELIFPTRVSDPGSYIVASATHSLIDAGIPGKDAHTIAESFDYFGAHLQTEITPDHKHIILYCISKYLPDTLPLLLQIIKEADYPQTEIDNYITRMKQTLVVNREKVSWLARVNFNSSIYGNKSPYGYIPDESFYKLIERDSLLQNREESYSWSNCIVILSGRMPDNVISFVKDNLAAINISNTIGSNVKPDVEETPGKAKFRIEKKDAVQCGIRVGRKLFNKHHHDFQGLTVVNTILGGYFGSRLMSNIREDKGYTYGIGSAIIPNKDSGAFFITSEVGAQVVEPALKEIYFELQRLCDEQVPEEELNLVKNYMTGVFQRSIDGPFALADRYKGLRLWELEYDYLDRYLNLIREIDPGTIQKLATTYLHPDMMNEVVAG